MPAYARQGAARRLEDSAPRCPWLPSGSSAPATGSYLRSIPIRGRLWCRLSLLSLRRPRTCQQGSSTGPAGRIPDNPANAKIRRDSNRTLTFPRRSASMPIPIPVMAIASEGSVMMRLIITGSKPGNASPMAGSAGATAAPPMRMSMEEKSNVISVNLVGLNESRRIFSPQ